jgi:hypothetical protein
MAIQVRNANSSAKQIPNLATSQVPASNNNSGQPANGALPNVADLVEPQFVGLGCPNYNYCIDDDCPELPK